MPVVSLMRVTILFFFIIFGYFLRDIGRQRRGGVI
jgi:hypothetical protein